jgi:hypothetical protein
MSASSVSSSASCSAEYAHRYHHAKLNEIQRPHSIVFLQSVIPIHPSVLFQRFPEAHTGKFKDLSEVTARKIVEYMYSDKINFKDISVDDIMDMIRVLHTIELDRLLALCHQGLKTTLGIHQYASALIFAKNHKLTRTIPLILNIIHGNIQEFIRRRDQVQMLGIDTFQEIILLSMYEHEELEIVVPDSTYESDLKEIKALMKTDISVETLAKYMSEYVTVAPPGDGSMTKKAGH